MKANICRWSSDFLLLFCERGFKVCGNYEGVPKVSEIKYRDPNGRGRQSHSRSTQYSNIRLGTAESVRKSLWMLSYISCKSLLPLIYAHFAIAEPGNKTIGR